MGARISLPDGTIEKTWGPGVSIESDQDRHPVLVRRLTLSPGAPLYPTVDWRLTWPKQPHPAAPLSPAIYVVEALDVPFGALREAAQAFRYLVVEPGAARWATEAEALMALGAVEALRALGLDDAAVALTMGDLDASRVQWIRWRDSQRG